jgi:hypothetical protein
MPRKPTESQPPLPGLDLDELLPNRGSLRNGVLLTLEALKAESLLTPIYTAQAQLALVLADVVEKAAGKGQAAAAGLAARQLIDALDALPKPLDADTADKFATLVAVLEAEVNKPRARR